MEDLEEREEVMLKSGNGATSRAPVRANKNEIGLLKAPL